MTPKEKIKRHHWNSPEESRQVCVDCGCVKHAHAKLTTQYYFQNQLFSYAPPCQVKKELETLNK